MSDAYLRFWGVRGSYSAPFESHLGVGGNTSCVEVRVDDQIVICDAGTGIIPLGNELMAQSKIRNLLVILTHYHWDHICGLPFFVPAFVPDWNIDFFGPGQCDDEIKEHVSAQMQAPYFPVGTETWLANVNYLKPTKNQEIAQGPISFEYHNVHHPGTTYGYRIKAMGKSILYISDNECSYLGKSIDRKSDELTEEEKQLYEEMKKEEHLAEIEMVKDADILIHDAQYTPEDYEKKRGWGHSCYIDTVNIAIEAGVKELYLYHHDPNYDDDAMEKIHQHSLSIIEEKNSSLKCFIAREGLIVDLS
ncbi:MAG: MBL fold metallo-hydrolase [Gammaproteobacteria bacterium]|jgi:phosphoribosyl 1,2-cyclic phosphodiesterase|nr:MBL fold metallo-hydrolase [Gammaproteobacteria bacterium]